MTTPFKTYYVQFFLPKISIIWYILILRMKILVSGWLRYDLLEIMKLHCLKYTWKVGMNISAATFSAELRIRYFFCQIRIRMGRSLRIRIRLFRSFLILTLFGTGSRYGSFSDSAIKYEPFFGKKCNYTPSWTKCIGNFDYVKVELLLLFFFKMLDSTCQVITDHDMSRSIVSERIRISELLKKIEIKY